MCAHPEYALSCMSMDSDSVRVSPVRLEAPRLGGLFAGEEKMPEIGSRPCSSRNPLSGSSMPVFLPLLSEVVLKYRFVVLLPSLDADIIELIFANIAFSRRRHFENYDFEPEQRLYVEIDASSVGT
jgi:hypothetical protein